MISLTITVNNLNKRSGPATSYSVVGKLNKGDVVYSQEKIFKGDERWYKLSDGSYVCGYTPKEGWYLKDTPKNPAKPTDTSPPKDPSLSGVTDVNSTSVGSGLDSKINEMLNQTIKTKVGMIDPNTRHLGQPHQFLPATDYRNQATTDIGRKYLENIFSEAPVVTIIPGKPNYMPDATEETKKTLASVISGKGKDGNAQSAIADILSKSDDMRYFGFIPDYSEYIRYVNLLCRVTAVYLGIGDVMASGALETLYKNYNWANYKYRDAERRTNREQDGTFNMTLWDAVKTAVGDMVSEVTTPDYVNFYVDSNTSFNESADNSTTQSQLESTLSNTLEGLSKEISFWLNAGGAGMADDIKQGLASSIGSIGESSLTKKGGILDRVIGASTNIIQGSNMIFPELWSDSGYGKSYTINMTLQSPYGDKESIYLNVLVPMMHVLALALPRQTSANSFTTPFILRAFSPGWFVCDMGIVTSMSIDKNEWTVDGLPSEVKISFTIKDLYSQLMVTSAHNPGDFFNNEGLMDFLAVTAGLNILKPDLKVKLETIAETLINKFTDIPANLFQDFMGSIKGFFMDFFGFR